MENRRKRAISTQSLTLGALLTAMVVVLQLLGSFIRFGPFSISLVLVPIVIGKYKAGRYQELPKLVRHIRTDKITILCDKPTAINLDGELRTAQKVEMSVAKEKVRFFYPKGLSFAVKEPVKA